MRKYNMEPTKKDWKLFREKIGGWQETYMERLINAVEYLVSRQETANANRKFEESE